MLLSKDHIRRIKRYLVVKFRKRAEPKTITDDRESLDVASKVIMKWPEDIKKPYVGLVIDYRKLPYWTKYERFLKSNSIPYKYLNIHESDWRYKVEKFDQIIWPIGGSPPELAEARRKIFIIENLLKVKCYPSFFTVNLIGEKITQYDLLKSYDFPIIDTFISYSYSDVLRNIEKLKYPLVSKITTGAGSAGVHLIKNLKDARKTVRKIFSFYGKNTYWYFQRQKNYIFFQEFIDGAKYDLRIFVVGNKVFGYYRDVPEGDFRASGLGKVRKDDIPIRAMDIAVNIYKALNIPLVAVDMLKNPKTDDYNIIELALVPAIRTSEQLHVNGIPGAYIIGKDGKYSFEEGRHWVQELALKEYFRKIWLTDRGVKEFEKIKSTNNPSNPNMGT